MCIRLEQSADTLGQRPWPVGSGGGACRPPMVKTMLKGKLPMAKASAEVDLLCSRRSDDDVVYLWRWDNFTGRPRPRPESVPVEFRLPVLIFS